MMSPSLANIHNTMQHITILHEFGTNWAGASCKRKKSSLMNG